MLIACGGQAFASAVLTCSISDKSLELNLQGTVSHGVGEVLVSVEGTMTATAAVLSKGMGSLTLEREHITQYWLGRQDLKLRIYRESAGEPHETLDLVIEARRTGGPDSVDFDGTYKGSATSMAGVTTGEARSEPLKGRVSCQLG